MPLAYQLTKPLKLGMSYGEDGVFKFVLQEVTATGDDNFELQIADYYKHFPKDDDDESGEYTDIVSNDIDEPLSDNQGNPTNRKGWL